MMKTGKIKNANNIGWIVIATAIILLYASYFFIYIPRQESLVEERGFRILEEYATNMHDKLNYYQNHLDNYGAFYALASEKDSILLKNKQIRKVLEDLEGTIRIKTKGSQEDSGHLFNYDSKYPDRISYYFTYTSPDSKKGKFKEGLSSNKDEKTEPDKKGVALIPIQTLMEGIKFDKLFENIALLDSTSVLHNSNLNLVDDITNAKILQDTISKKQGGIILSMEIRGVKNHVMILPFTIIDKTFYLAGFIADSNFKKKTKTINSQLLTIISGILLLILIGMPVLKIIFINHNERLNVTDAQNATISLILGVSVLMLLFIGTIKLYFIDRSVADDRIIKISNKIYGNVEHDFKGLINLGDIIINNESDSNPLATFARNSLKEKEELEKYDTIPKNLLVGQIPVNEILLMDSEGTVTKAVTSTAFSELVTLDLSERAYFKNLKDTNRSWPLNKLPFEGYFIESIKSYNTGGKETAISFRLDKKGIDVFGAPYFAITSHIPSLYDQILPQDVGFVVINQKGEVLFHSDQSKNLHENFLVECNYHPRLIGALDYRISETINITYNEKQWLARIVPMKNMPLYHITLLDLEYTNDKNARIYLFTFYFILITFLCIIVGMQIIQRVKPSKGFMATKSWSFKWIIFQQKDYYLYVSLVIIQSIILSGQLFGLLIIKQPVTMLLYQLIFIAYSGFSALVVLTNSKLRISSSLFFVIIVILFVLLIKFLPISIIPVSIVLCTTTVIILFVLKNKTYFVSEKAKNVYLTFMFLWLAGLTAVPVITYFQSIKLQEEKLSVQNQMLHVAHQNVIMRNQHDEQYSGLTYTEINGNGIDGLTISTDNKLKENNCPNHNSPNQYQGDTLDYPDYLYSRLPSPLTKDDYLMALLKTRNQDTTWWVTDSSLVYSTAGMKGQFTVDSDNFRNINVSNGTISAGINNMKPFEWLIHLFIPIILLVLFIWSVFQFLADNILGTILAKWLIPKTPSWKGLLNNPQINRILLISFNGNNYLDETKMLDKPNSQIKYTPTIIMADQIADWDCDVNSLIADYDDFIWIRGLGEYVLKFNNFELVLNRLMEIDKIATGKVLVELPFDTDFLQEYMEDYLTEYDLDKDEEIGMMSLKRDLGGLFKTFFRYTGMLDDRFLHPLFEEYITENISNNSYNNYEQNVLANEHLLKLHYNFIWNNLSRLEKMILFDLADDGMLNFKNKLLINRLQRKGLITLFPVPGIFTPSFQNFLLFSIKPEETVSLEHKLRKHGKWNNMRYMILLILIPLGGFIFISMGTSIEKIVGIFTGVLALFSGVMRLTDSNFFRSSTK